MRLKDLAKIILVCCLLANTISLIFITEWAQNILKNWPQAIVLGIIIFTFQAIILAGFVKPYFNEISFSTLFDGKKLLVALFMGFVVWTLAQIWVHYATGIPIHYPSSPRVKKYLFIFLLNSIPAALIEEFIFRFLPVQYAEKKEIPRQQLIGLAIGVAVVFSLSHVSAYVFRDHTDVSGLASPLISAFFYGMAYFFVYVVTDNIYFTTLIHAFSNNQLYLVNSPYNDSFYFYTLIFVTLVWFMRKETQRVRS
ncbi:type II CAAX prenyl endopeptidase Rce1 family protein [Dyadobacter subterraneus]|uniref:CPBP family intramembrane metalloprotease n=1 Tax=Dyadobacter subterraneus TaxID=2773304 RepID=A0ABR9WLY4_9BACT|nr:CPBP family intramembrane glutamic endopeptidase [Dyadobacter subterraneus]MBE9466442.1 CPBP family intramembrane metalloprotease [Dyadobacter subterraneus]